MAIRYLNGFRLRNVVLAGAEKVIQQQQYLNKINVFPVPDGDTGSNMASTFESISEAAKQRPNIHLGEMSTILADAALTGSRGNSGAILTQFFQGLADAVGRKMRISLTQFAEVVEKATNAAKAAILNPVEGTMITVMREWADWIKTNANKFDSFEALIHHSLFEAQTSLTNTQQTLDSLKKAQVVDAGAQGFVYFLQGISEHLAQMPKQYYFDIRNQINKLKQRLTPKAKVLVNDEFAIVPQEQHEGDIHFQYCTECLFCGENLDLDQIRHTLADWGNSVVVVGNRQKVKVHIHTNDADRVFRLLANWGELLQTKAEDMWAQYRNTIGVHANREIAIITDSSCSLPQEYIVKNNIHVVPFQVVINETTYIDKVNLSNERCFVLMRDPKNHLSTSQPSPLDFVRAYDQAARHAKYGVGLFISGELSGTYQGAIKSLERFTDMPVAAIDSKNLIGGLGLITMIAVEAVQAQISRDEMLRRIQYAIAHTHTLVAPASLDAFIKGGRVPKSFGRFAKLLRLLPILKVEAGIVKKAGVSFGAGNARRKVVNMISRFASQLIQPRMIVVHTDAEAKAQQMARQLAERFKCEVPVVAASPMVVSHSGLGTVAVSLFGFGNATEVF